jgi:hypothetical protein
VFDNKGGSVEIKTLIKLEGTKKEGKRDNKT